jgi:hypothetical protein
MESSVAKKLREALIPEWYMRYDTLNDANYYLGIKLGGKRKCTLYHGGSIRAASTNYNISRSSFAHHHATVVKLSAGVQPAKEGANTLRCGIENVPKRTHVHK